MLNLSEASRICGKDRTTLYRWIRTGRLSAKKQDDGGFLIDPVELHRVCPYVVNDNVKDVKNVSEGVAESSIRNNMTHGIDVAVVEELATLRAENRLLREMTDDLRTRLDKESEDRRRLTYLLEHKVEVSPSVNDEKS
ncbi:helix-turn-helix domain-containing protein, partial [bacterium]|nr:helix-turn-helix domain-containing protein [bacterium]